MTRRNGHRDRSREKRRVAPGAPPGTIIVDNTAPKSVVSVMAYSHDAYAEQNNACLTDVPALRKQWPVVWVNIDGLGDADLLKRAAQVFGMHPLALEDVVNVHQRAKLDRFGDQYFVVTHMAMLQHHDLEIEQVSVVFGKGWVLTFQERPGWDCLEHVRMRIRRSGNKLHEYGADYLLYSLLDAVVDHFFPVLESLNDRLETLEDQILEHPSRAAIADLHAVKRQLLQIRRTAWPQREMLNALIREQIPEIGDETRLYLRDVYDHSVRVIDLVETAREVCSDLMDLYLSSISHRMNDVMRVLTVISTLFIPLTFIAGVYGMNFSTEASAWNMPELNWPWGYAACLVLMVAITVGQMIFFYRRGWLGHPRDLT